MKIAVDLDGTAWRYQRVFVELMRALQGAGHEIGILTNHHDDLRESDLRLWAERGFPEPDFFLNQGHMAGLPPALAHVRERKIAVALQHGVDIAIDDFDNAHGGGIIEFVVLRP